MALARQVREAAQARKERAAEIIRHWRETGVADCKAATLKR